MEEEEDPLITNYCIFIFISFSYLRLFGESINHALQVSLGSGSKKDSHVFKISVVRGK